MKIIWTVQSCIVYENNAHSRNFVSTHMYEQFLQMY